MSNTTLVFETGNCYLVIPRKMNGDVANYMISLYWENPDEKKKLEEAINSKIADKSFCPLEFTYSGMLSVYEKIDEFNKKTYSATFNFLGNGGTISSIKVTQPNPKNNETWACAFQLEENSRQQIQNKMDQVHISPPQPIETDQSTSTVKNNTTSSIASTAYYSKEAIVTAANQNRQPPQPVEQSSSSVIINLPELKTPPPLPPAHTVSSEDIAGVGMLMIPQEELQEILLYFKKSIFISILTLLVTLIAHVTFLIMYGITMPMFIIVVFMTIAMASISVVILNVLYRLRDILLDYATPVPAEQPPHPHTAYMPSQPNAESPQNADNIEFAAAEFYASGSIIDSTNKQPSQPPAHAQNETGWLTLLVSDAKENAKEHWLITGSIALIPVMIIFWMFVLKNNQSQSPGLVFLSLLCILLTIPFICNTFYTEGTTRLIFGVLTGALIIGDIAAFNEFGSEMLSALNDIGPSAVIVITLIIADKTYNKLSSK